MALELAAFLVLFPEFGEVDDSLVEGKLAEALRSIDADVWGDFADDGQGYLAAHLLALSPMGNAAKLVDGKKNTTTYEGHLRRLQLQVTAGIRST
jgi:hypothetical protein